MLEVFKNFDLLSVGLAVAATTVLGFTVYFNNPKSITNKTFFVFSLVTAVWGAFNYISYQFESPIITLWFLRLVLFFATWQAFTMFLLCYVFPENNKKFSKVLKFLIIPWSILISILTLTPFIFIDATRFLKSARVANPIMNKFGIIIFGISTISLVIYGIIILFKKVLSAPSDIKKRMQIILVSLFLSLGLIVTFTFLFPVLLDNVNLIPLGALFSFPFAFLSSYAILKHKLFNIKNLTSAILAFLLCLIIFIEIIFANSLNLIIFRVSIFILVLIISIQFIKNIFNLEVANEQKSEFMSFAAHEIRTPLTAVKGYASLILEGDMGEINPQVKDAAQKIMISSNSVITLINQYLNKSKMELSQLSYSLTVFDLGKLVKDIVQNFQVNVEQKGIILTAEVNSSLTYNVNADEGKIGEVIGNIIDNAIKYTDKGSVVVSITKKNGKVLVKIADTGVGIERETMPKLFKKFSKAETGKGNLLGTGLGLFLAKTFIDAHKGRVWAESKGKGQGSQFYVELPAENNNK